MVENNLIILGMITVFIGFIIILLGAVLNSRGKTEFGFVGFIGPIPIGFGSNKEILYLTLITVIIAMIFFLMFLRGFKL